ncbi:hypothetical protein BDR26DRAFT_1010648 [Obelidium mucronatum]|nr:hypothetical protein BDR26DRAFT_1010648 [Obelidium mucronatum]
MGAPHADAPHMPFRYLHFVSPRIDTFLFVGIGLAAFALHERDRLKARAKGRTTDDTPVTATADIGSLALHQLVLRKFDRWRNGVAVPTRTEALGLEIKDWKEALQL